MAYRLRARLTGIEDLCRITSYVMGSGVASAGVAQLVEQLTCNQQVVRSNRIAGSRQTNVFDVVGWPSGQRQQTVNLSARAYVGSNPTSTIICIALFQSVQ